MIVSQDSLTEEYPFAVPEHAEQKFANKAYLTQGETGLLTGCHPLAKFIWGLDYRDGPTTYLLSQWMEENLDPPPP